MSSSNLSVGVGSFVITPHASTNFTRTARSIYVGASGNVAVVNLDDSVCIWPNVPAGGYILCECKRVNVSGTTASNLIGIN